MALVRRMVGCLLLVEAILLFLAATDGGVGRAIRSALAASILGPVGYGEWLAGIWIRGAGLIGAAAIGAGWWLARGKQGARGLSAALLLWHLPVLCWGSILGLAGLVGLWKDSDSRNGQWIGVNPGWQMAVAAIGGTYSIFPLLAGYGHFMGLPRHWGETPALVAVVLAEIFFGMFHEFGHWLAMQVLAFEGGSIVWGPVAGRLTGNGTWNWTVRKSNIGRWGAGYLHAAPSTMEGAATAWALIALAGPGTSLFYGLCFLLGMLMLPGSHLEAYWEWAALASAAFMSNTIVNLLPVGGSDGAQILHSLAGTSRGKRILGELELAMYRVQGEQDLEDQDYHQKAALLASRIEELRRRGESDQLGPLLSEWGHALLEIGEPQRAMEILEEARRHLGSDQEAHAWSWLWTRTAAIQLGRHAHRNVAREKALECIQRVRKGNGKWKEIMGLIAEAAELHLEGKEPETAQELIAGLMPYVPERNAMRPLAGKLHGLSSVAEFELGQQTAASQSLRRALQLLSITGNRPVLRRQCARVQCRLAELLLNCDQEDLAVAVMRDAANQFAQSGPPVLEGRTRLRLAEILLTLGRYDKARQCLEEGARWQAALEAEPNSQTRWEILRTQLHLAGAATRAATAKPDSTRQLLDHLERQATADDLPESGKIQQACGLAVLAEVLRASGEQERARDMARRSCAELVPRNHTEAINSLATMALLYWEENPEDGDAYFLEALRIAAEAHWEPACSRARALERLAERLEKASRHSEAQAALAAAQQLRRHRQAREPVTAGSAQSPGS